MKMKLFFIAIFSTVLLSSCLKSDDQFGFDEDKGSIVSEIFDRSYYGDTKVIALEATPPTETFDVIQLRMYAPRSLKPNADITATLTTANPAAATGLSTLPVAAYSIPSLSVSIPKNGGVIDIPMTLNKGLLDLSQTYGLIFNLTTVSEGVISELAHQVTVAFIIKNAYHADYDVDGYFFHPSAGSSRAIDLTKELGTVGAARSQGQVGDLAGWYFNFDISGSTLSNWGAAGAAPAPPASGFFTADNPGGITYPDAPPGPGIAPWVQTTYNNTYNPATKTFLFHYGYGGGSTSQNGWTRNIYEKWVRL